MKEWVSLHLIFLIAGFLSKKRVLMHLDCYNIIPTTLVYILTVRTIPTLSL